MSNEPSAVVEVAEGKPHMLDRDPNGLNDNVQVAFEEVIGEPDGAHSADCAWVCSYKCYEGGKNICYKVLTYVCAAPLALCWGCQFACITFAHIWYITPFHRVLTIWCGTCQGFYHTLVSCFLAPLCETYGLVFSKIKVQSV